jgi:outer membrane protein assembly factor BamB
MEAGMKQTSRKLKLIAIVSLLIIGACAAPPTPTPLPSATPIPPAAVSAPSPQIETLGLQLTSDGAPNVVASIYDASQQTYEVARLDLGTHRVLWKALGQKDKLALDAVVSGDTLLYVVINTRLLALQLSDGQKAWEAALPDKLLGACQRCLVYQNGQVLALTADNSLGGYDAKTGNQNWEKHFNKTGRELTPVGKGVAMAYVFKTTAALGIFDAATGDNPIDMQATCPAKGSPSDPLDPGAKIVFDTASQPAKAYLFYGLSSACVKRWDLSTGKMDWEQAGAQRLNPTDVPILANGTFFYASAQELRSLDAATGTHVQTLDQTQDYALVPLLVDGNRLIVRAKRTQGTSPDELWGYDLGSGKNIWKRPLTNSQSIDPPGAMLGQIDKSSSGWTYYHTADGLWLITFQNQPSQISVAQVNLDTGELSNPKILSLGFDESSTTKYDIPKRLEGSGRLPGYLVSNQLYFIDPTADKFPYRWP